MSESKQDLERDLRRALQTCDPGPELAHRVVASLARARAEALERRRRLTRWTPLALAASVIAGFLIVRSDQRELDARRGLAARAQAIEALRIASRSLDSAHRIATGD